MGLLSSKDTNSDYDLVTDFHFPTSKHALIIFTRNPELGKCKTRLAKTLGDEAALDIYKHLLQHTAQISEQVTADRFVFYSEEIYTNDLWNSTNFRKKLQNGSDLGERMHNAFSELFNSGYEKIIIIGSDLLDLTPLYIEEAFKTLDTNDVTIGPAKDGGYYLLGSKEMHPTIFQHKTWGTSTVLKDTLTDLQNQKVYLLEELNDIDTFEDMKHYKELEKFY